MSETPTWGATPEDWQHFVKLGLTADLLPVVSNPHARISDRSKMQDLGKTPSMYNRNSEVTGYPQWTQVQARDRDIKRWQGFPDYGICLQTRRVRAIDIDIENVAQAERVVEMVELVLGPLPMRWRRDSGKRLLVLEIKAPLTKRVLHTEHGAIEFLADGQQFIAIGTHPKGARYEWAGGLPNEIPEVTLAEFEELWAALSKELGAEDHRQRRSITPAVPRAASQAWPDPMVPWLEENGWVREFERDGRIHIRCPFEHEHTTDSGPSATTYFPAGVGGFQQGHFRCLHAHCVGRSDRDFEKGVGLSIASEFEPVVADEVSSGEGPGVVMTTQGGVPGFEDQGDWPHVTRKKNGRIEPSARNVHAMMLRPDLVHVRLCYDSFKDHVMIARPGDTTWRPFKDTDYFHVRCELERIGFDAPGHELVRAAVNATAQHHTIDSAIEWARSLRWDGVPRVEQFFHRYLRTLDTPYTRAVGQYLWTALAGRCLEPGIKADMVPVLVSKQGTSKTSTVEAIAPSEEMFAEIDLGKDDDKLARLMRGKLVAEIAELRGLQGRDAESNKAFITRRFEEWTPKFIEYAKKMPRRLVFIGTSNKEFLDDETGERRWLPVEVGNTDLKALRADVEQLWAEGIERFEAGGIAWQDAEALAEGEHAAFKVQDPWTDAIAHWLSEGVMDDPEGTPRSEGWVRATDVLTSAVNLSLREIAKPTEMRAARVLTALGFVKKDRWVEGRSRKAWIKPGSAAWVAQYGAVSPPKVER